MPRDVSLISEEIKRRNITVIDVIKAHKNAKGQHVICDLQPCLKT